MLVGSVDGRWRAEEALCVSTVEEVEFEFLSSFFDSCVVDLHFSLMLEQLATLALVRRMIEA